VSSLRRFLGKKIRYLLPRGEIREYRMGLDLVYEPATDVGRELYCRGSFEMDELNFFAHKLKAVENPVFLDIGANIGVHSTFWGKQCVDATGYLFEPSERTLKTLKRNIINNGLSDMLFVEMKAVSSEQGEMDFYECSDNAFSSLRDTKRKRVRSKVKVSVVTLDDWIQEKGFEKLDFIKIDVEGFEEEVIRGGVETLTGYRPDLFVEIYGGKNSNPDPQGTVDLIRSLRYEAFIFNKDGKIEPFVEHTDSCYSYYFSPA
jgi:FkbM family methyltransferase